VVSAHMSIRIVNTKPYSPSESAIVLTSSTLCTISLLISTTCGSCHIILLQVDQRR
jgi:hypothetical protein